MSIHTRGYFLECDNPACGDQFDPANGDEVSDVEAIIAEALTEGWIDITGKDDDGIKRRQFCPECSGHLDDAAAQDRKEKP